MSKPQILRFLRVKVITGRHLNTAFINQEVREEGWQRIQRARRIARRLDIDLRNLT